MIGCSDLAVRTKLARGAGKEFVFTMDGFGSEDLPLPWPQ